MDRLINSVGNIAAVAGIALCATAGIVRLFGYYYFLGYEGMTLFMAGVGLMVLACLAKLERISAAMR